MPRDLRDYRARRDFDKTPEPSGAERVVGGRRLVVQKHAARRLHYDLRLEWDGVLLSWAVTRGPSTDPRARRLAVRTEDHPLDYGSFEGTIGEKQYGAGTVMLWDSGTWAPLEDVDQGLAKGKLKFVAAGERMRGGWTLVRIKPRPGEKRDNWLLIKERDAHTSPDAEALVGAHQTSVSSGRTMAEIAAGKIARKKTGRSKRGVKVAEQGGAKRQRAGKHNAPPGFRKPQLATLNAHAPEGDDWLHEIKFDGYRCLAAIGGGQVTLYSRSGHDWTSQFGVLVPDFEQLQGRSALIDGEVIAPGPPQGAFGELQARLKHGGELLFMAFDLLELDGRDLAPRPQLERKDMLERLLDGAELRAIRYSTHLRGHAAAILEKVCAAGQEGIISKHAGSPYRSGRHTSWRKIKCIRRQEFVIGGWMPSDAHGRPFSSLLMGTYEDGALRYRGRVGSGFGSREFEVLAPRMARLSRATSPFDPAPPIRKDVRWLTPRLVAEVQYAELTSDGHIRHGVYLGLREDKPVKETRLETTAQQEAADLPAKTFGKKHATVEGVRITSPDRKVYTKPRVSKLRVAQHNAALAARMLPFARNRPIALLRCPDGIEGECFFQKHRRQGMPEAVRTVNLRRSSGAEADFICLSDVQGLVGAAQMGAIEFHIWGSSVNRLEQPDRLVFDLDPDEGLAFAKVRKAALELRGWLEQLGLPSVAMLTGGKGIHVIVCLRPKAEWNTVKLFTRTVATLMAEHAPGRYTATMAKSQRKDRIFVDWLRNERGSTAVAPYSLRARPGAKVAVPVTWDELAASRSAGAFDINSVVQRLDHPCPLAEAAKSPVTLGQRVIRKLEKIRLGGDS
jgi:bifunctional non-homologous end joining protein LigD